MSYYVRKKCVRFKIPQNIIEELENDDDWVVDLLLEKFNVKDDYNTENDFTIGYGEDFGNNKTDYFLDYQLEYEYGAAGDFESVRLLTDKEFEGICVGIFTKNIKREYVDCVNDVDYEGYNREEQFIHTELKEPIQVAKVFYGNNKSKIVPIDKVGTWQSPF